MDDILEALVEQWEDNNNDRYEIEKQIDAVCKEQNLDYELYTTHAFESPGYDLYILFLAWVEDGKLQTLHGECEYC